MTADEYGDGGAPRWRRQITAQPRIRRRSHRLGAWTGTGVNTLLGAFKALLSKAAALPSDITGTGDPATDSVEALAEAIAAIPTNPYTGTPPSTSDIVRNPHIDS